MGGNLTVLDKQKRLVFSIILNLTPEWPDTILVKRLSNHYLFEYTSKSQCSFKTQGIER